MSFHNYNNGARNHQPPPFDYRPLLDFDNLIGNLDKADDFARRLSNTSSSQLRKYYDFLVRLSKKAEKGKIAEVKLELKLLKARLHYALNRKKIDLELKVYLEKAINQLVAYDDEKFKKYYTNRFLKVMEAIVGYHKQYHKQ